MSLVNIEQLSVEFLKLATLKKPIYLYHGTSGKNLQSILSSGLLANPKNRAWETDDDASFGGRSRQSLPGIYLTNNLMTAYSSTGNAGNKGKGSKVILIVEVSPTSLYADEDNLNTFSYPLKNDNDRIIAEIFAAYNKYGSESETVSHFYNEYKDKIKFWLEYSEIKANKNLLNRLYEVLFNVFIAAIFRKAAYLEDYIYRSVMYNYYKDPEDFPKRPEKAKAEADYKKQEDMLSKILKHIGQKGEFNSTSRIINDVGFNKPGYRIVAIVEIEGGFSDRAIRLIYPNSTNDIPKEAWDKFVSDWKSNIGEFNISKAAASMLEKAIKHYGLTDDPGKAAYILPDGTFLDFSEGSDTRTMDHRNVEFLVNKKYEYRTESMRHFMRNTGAIRFMPESGCIDIIKKPTERQLRAISEISELFNEIIIDLNKGSKKFSKEYESWNKKEIIKDIREFWGMQ